MLLKRFKQQMDGAPVHEHEMAEAAQEVVDDYVLSSAAGAFLEARRHFFQVLSEVDVELG